MLAVKCPFLLHILPEFLKESFITDFLANLVWAEIKLADEETSLVIFTQR